MQELDRRFGCPEQIVLREVAATLALPKLSIDNKELAGFASRVRNVPVLYSNTSYIFLKSFWPLLE